MKGPPVIAQLKSILALPFVVIVVIPAIIYYAVNNLAFKPLYRLDADIRFGIASLFMLVGLLLFIKSIDLFIKIGKGTLAPWDPTKKLVVKGMYRHMRNPMITGVLCILIAEGFLFPSVFVLFWALGFLLINHLYFIWKEEPDLLKRFGEEYKEYKQNVPRWIPRLKGWMPENS